MVSYNLDLKNISKIEGHTHMFVKVKDKKVLECKLKISENQRFFKKAVEGMEYGLVPNRMARVCGTCSAAHLMASIEAIEKAFDVKVTGQTWDLRRLMINAGHIRDHAMHLYFFCLPDVFGMESVFDFVGPLKEWINMGLAVKDAGNYLATIVSGRAVHPTSATVGGFTKFPTSSEMKIAIGKLEKVRPLVLKIIDLFYNDRREFKRKSNYVGLINPDYNYMKGKIMTSKGTEILEEDFRKHLEETIVPYSTSSHIKFDGGDFMVGALARLNVNKESLHTRTKEDCKIYLKIFPNNCVFNNNTAQAIET
jgi:sulfhydrogenase subunit alpha